MCTERNIFPPGKTWATSSGFHKEEHFLFQGGPGPLLPGFTTCPAGSNSLLQCVLRGALSPPGETWATFSRFHRYDDNNEGPLLQEPQEGLQTQTEKNIRGKYVVNTRREQSFECHHKGGPSDAERHDAGCNPHHVFPRRMGSPNDGPQNSVLPTYLPRIYHVCCSLCVCDHSCGSCRRCSGRQPCTLRCCHCCT